jgi:hypothetical protein
MFVLTVVETDQGLAVLLTDEAAIALRVKAGDKLRVGERRDGAFDLYGRGPDIAEEIEIGERFMDEYRGTFSRLAAS